MRSSTRSLFIQLSALTLLLLAQESPAADLPTRKAPPIAPPPIFTWTGFYVGFNFGYTWTASPSIVAGSANLVDFSAERFGLASAISASGVPSARLDGFFFGGQAGYNWQFADKLIAGFEADIQGAGVRGGGGLANVTGAPTGFAVTGGKLNRSLEYLGTARGRLGYAVTPTIMAYVTGGLAYGGANLTTTIRQSLTPSILIGNPGKGDLYENLVGWTIGAGGEMALSRNLSAKLEYLYYDLGGLQLSTASNPLAFTDPLLGLRLVDATNVSTRFNGHIIRAGLNYRFDWSIPETPGSPATPLFASPQFASAEAPVLSDWRFMVMPYMWAINLNGALNDSQSERRSERNDHRRDHEEQLLSARLHGTRRSEQWAILALWRFCLGAATIFGLDSEAAIALCGRCFCTRREWTYAADDGDWRGRRRL